MHERFHVDGNCFDHFSIGGFNKRRKIQKIRRIKAALWTVLALIFWGMFLSCKN